MAPAAADWLEELAGLAPEESRHAEFFAGRAELRSSRTVEQLHQEVLRVLYADLKRADRLARAASVLAEELGGGVSRAFALRAVAHVSYAGSRFEDAARDYERALQIFASLGNDRESGRTLISGLQSLIYLGRYDDAFQWAARAREIFTRLGDPLRLARLASNVGNIYFRQDRYSEALAMYREAHDTLSDRGEPRDVAAVLSNIAVCQISLGLYGEALESYRLAREYCQRHGLPTLVAGADYNIAYLHYLQGDFLRAIELYQASREHCRAAGDHYHAALCDLDEAEIYLELNLNPEAARLAGQAADGFAALGMAYERGKALVTHGVAVSRRGRSRSARKLLSEARDVFVAESNPQWPALIDLTQAILLERDNHDREAARLCRYAYDVLKGSDLPGQAVLAELLQARLMLKARQVEKARAACQRAMERLHDAGRPWLWFHAWFVQGQVEEHSGNDGAAFNAFQAAREQIEAMRSQLWGDEPRISFLKDKLAVYEKLVSAHLAPQRDPPVSAAQALLYIQEAKSRSLVDMIGRGPSGVWPAGESADIEETRRNLNVLYRHMEHLALSAQTGGARVHGLKQTVRELEGKLVRLMADASPDPASKAYHPQSLTVEAIQAAIPRDAKLLEYYVVRGVLCVAVVDAAGVEIVPLGGVEAVRNRMRLLQFQMRKRAGRTDASVTARAAEPATETHLRDLYDDLLAPIESRLAGTEHLILAPHDFLHHVPFHALRLPQCYVIDRFTVSYAPSATVFALCHGRTGGGGNSSLVMGISDRLAPQTALEASAAAENLPGVRLFLDGQATERVLRDMAGEARFIHIATHGLFRRDNPLFSAIRLGDSHLTLLDLYHLPLNAELVILSGCSTGLSVVVGGDELLGLMRGLLLAGARGAMVSLWDVNDRSTAQFMQLFYGNLGDGAGKARALQRAMHGLRERYPHPYYWAPFVLAGKYD